MRCVQCRTPLGETEQIDNREKHGEMLFRYTCPGCNAIYESQLVTISVIIHPGDERQSQLLKHCHDCGQLYDQSHSCQE